MTTIPQLIFLDTNVYLIGAVDLDSAEGQILQRLGWEFQGNFRILAQQTGEFECLTPSEFVSKYLNS